MMGNGDGVKSYRLQNLGDDLLRFGERRDRCDGNARAGKRKNAGQARWRDKFAHARIDARLQPETRKVAGAVRRATERPAFAGFAGLSNRAAGPAGNKYF